MPAYNYACALTGYMPDTLSSSMIDAAHIHSFANSRNNNPTNGIALSKNAHWLFDQGLWTIDDNYRVIVALGKFSESSPNDRALKDYHGEQILLPEDIKLRPNPVQLAWHRKNRFLGV